MPSIDVNGTQLYYEDHGPKDAPAVVFSHSLFFHSRMFYQQASHFLMDYRIIRYDHRGQGKSARAPVEELNMETLAEDAAALIEALDLRRCHFVGNSQGGFIALRLAARRPDLIASCAVLGSSGNHEFKVAEFQPLVERMQQDGAAPVVDTLMYIMFGDSSLGDPAFGDELAYWRNYIQQLDTGIGDCAYQVVHRRSVLQELKGCEVPMLVVAGAEDHAYPPELSQRIVDTVANGRLEVVPRAGHSVALERADVVNRLLANHFEYAAQPA